MELIKNIVDGGNAIIWSDFVLLIFLGIGVYFTFRLKFMQVLKQSQLWKNIFSGKDSKYGISSFASFWTAMSTRIGTGNIAGVAIAIYFGGPGVLFWMWVYGFFICAFTFVECCVGALYKTKIDGEYRGSCAICASKALGLKKYAVLITVVLGITTGLLLPAAEAFTLTDAIYNASMIPKWVISLVVASIVAVVIFGGIKRIGRFSGIFASTKVMLFVGSALIVILANVGKIPDVFVLIFSTAFDIQPAFWAGVGLTISYGFRRCQFATNSGSGENMPAASAAESKHPCEPAFGNTTGVLICVFGVCTCSGFMILLTGCVTPPEGLEPGIACVQAAYGTVFGANVANWLVAIIVILFSSTGIVGFYYESETAFLYLMSSQKARSIFKIVLRVFILGLLMFYGCIAGNLAWGISDLSLGITTIFNMVVIVALSPKAFLLYKDYVAQLKSGVTPVFDNSKYNIKGVDNNVWNGKR